MLQAARGLLDILRVGDLRIANQLASNIEDGCGRGTADRLLIDVAIKGFQGRPGLRCRSLISEMDAGQDLGLDMGVFVPVDFDWGIGSDQTSEACSSNERCERRH